MKKILQYSFCGLLYILHVITGEKIKVTLVYTITLQIAVSTPQLPSPELRQRPAEKPSVEKKDSVPSTPSTPDMHREAPVYDTPKPTISEAKPPISSNKPPKFSGGSYKKRQAPKPPVAGEDIKTHVRTPSQDLSRRDGFDKSPPSKKNNARFSLRRLLRLGKDERATSPESPSSPTSSPSPPGSPNRPEIIHPSMLDGREVQVVSRIQQTPPQTTNCVSATTPAGRPRPPPPPPRTLSLSGSSPPNPRPSRPPPPQSAQLLQMKERATESPNSEDDEHAVYANLDSVKNRNFNAANKPQRNGSMREGSPEWGQQMSPSSEDGDYETVQFLDGRLSRRRRSAVLSSLEENYGAVVGANHRALAQLMSSLCAVPLPACASTVLTTYAEEQGEGDETRTLVLLQSLAVLRDLQDVGTSLANIAHFHVLRPFENQKAAIGPRVKHLPTGEASSESLREIGQRACQLLQPSDPKLLVILTSAGLAKAVAYLEFKTWGPELDQSDKEVGLQRWLDLERATALQNLAQARDRLPVSQEMYVNFLVQASAIGLSQASLL
ncbi:hypothetical protein B566_EDAN011520 [Ephemera danica]|nr:hypothetical protein B566_EDAN011520 [Ephemera danica]